MVNACSIVVNLINGTLRLLSKFESILLKKYYEFCLLLLTDLLEMFLINFSENILESYLSVRRLLSSEYLIISDFSLKVSVVYDFLDILKGHENFKFFKAKILANWRNSL